MAANSTSFKPGRSYNPGGRSKQVLELVYMAREKCPKAIEVASEILESSESENRDKLAAAVFLRDLGCGKPSQIELDIAQVTDEELWKEVTRRRELALQQKQQPKPIVTTEQPQLPAH